MTSIEKLAGGFRSARLLRPKLRMLFDVEEAVTHTANIDPTKTHRTQIAGLQTNAREITSARQALAQVGGEKNDAFRFSTLIQRFALIFFLIVFPIRCHAQSNNISQISTLKITDIHQIIVKYGVNKVNLWGDQDDQSRGIYNSGTKKQITIMNSGIIIRADMGIPTGGDYDLYFLLMSRLDRQLIVSLPLENKTFFYAQPDAGQAVASAVRFFNGTWDNHEQTFAIYAKREIDEESGKTSTEVSILCFDPGLVFSDGSSYVPPYFKILKEYVRTAAIFDPEVTISNELSSLSSH